MGTSVDWFLPIVIFCLDVVFEHFAHAFAFGLGSLFAQRTRHHG